MPDLHFDATMGAAGDMLLAALIDAGADEAFTVSCITAIAPEAVVSFDGTTRGGMRARRALISAAAASDRSRTWASIRSDLQQVQLPEPVRNRALRAFGVLAEAEAGVHGVAVEDVHFHEVGALDSIVDVVGCCAALVSLAPGRVTCGPIATGTGYAATEHGRIPLPSPALLAVLSGSGASLTPGPAEFEACTPTAAALLATWTDEWTPGPQLSVTAIGVGAGTADPTTHANVTRVLLGDPATEPRPGHPNATTAGAMLLQTNIDDMDPRLWPAVVQQLLADGAADAWLTPILMKKGRPAHTLSVLCRPDLVDGLAASIMRHTTAIGMRVTTCDKIAAERSTATVTVFGQPIRVKVARFAGAVVNVQPEWEDVREAAEITGTPAKQVLAAAHEAAHGMWASSQP